MTARDRAAVFSPNRTVSPTVMKVLVGVQAAVALLVWAFSPFKVLPRPLEVVTALKELWFGQGLGPELFTSLRLNLTALTLSLLISLALAYLTVVPFFRPIAAVISKLRFLSLTGLTLVFTLLVGGGFPLKVSLLTFGMTVFFVTSMAAVVAEIPRDQFDYARTLRMSEWRVVGEVVVLGTVDKAVEALRQNAAIGWMMLTMVEGISRSEGGLGALLLNLNKHLDLPKVFAIQLFILVVGILQDYAIGGLGRLVAPHAVLARERR